VIKFAPKKFYEIDPLFTSQSYEDDFGLSLLTPFCKLGQSAGMKEKTFHHNLNGFKVDTKLLQNLVIGLAQMVAVSL
jgi:hypothetical protein